MDTLPPGWPGTVSDVGDLVELLQVNALPDAPARISAVGPFVVEGVDPFVVDAVAREGEVYSSELVAYVEEAEGLRHLVDALRVALETIATVAGESDGAKPEYADSYREADYLTALAEIRGLAGAVLRASAPS
jgi:hypothetical protein